MGNLKDRQYINNLTIKIKTMKNQILNLFIASTVFFGLTGCCGYRVVTCPDGRPVNLPKSERCAEKLYKDAVKQLDVNLKATVNVIDQVTVGIDNAQVKNDAILLKEKLDNESIRLQETMKGSFLGLRTDPCNSSAKHFKLLEAINDRNYKLQEIKAELSNNANEASIAKTLDNYSKGKIDGANMKALILAIDSYFTQNQKYPDSLDDLNLVDIITKLGGGRLEYKLDAPNKYTLRFAGEDYVLKTPDDKVYVGQSGVTTKQN